MSNVRPQGAAAQGNKSSVIKRNPSQNNAAARRPQPFAHAFNVGGRGNILGGSNPLGSAGIIDLYKKAEALGEDDKKQEEEDEYGEEDDY